MGYGISLSEVQHPERHMISLPHQTFLQLKGYTLERKDTSKYLGVVLQSPLAWKKHVDRVTRNAYSMLGFLRRNLKSTSIETKANAYFSMVRPNLEYCSTVWNPYQKEQKHKVEMVQRRAARYVTNRIETPEACHRC